MKIAEFLNIPNNYLATVRVVLLNRSTAARTIVTADSFQQAKLLLTRIYGDGNVLSINQMMNEDEEVSEGTQTLTPQQLQVKSLADKAKVATQQKKQLQARQAMQRAQAKMLDASKAATSA
jgi:hypothetical protein